MYELELVCICMYMFIKLTGERVRLLISCKLLRATVKIMRVQFYG